jgi:glucose/arabinose dehydrogenase
LQDTILKRAAACLVVTFWVGAAQAGPVSPDTPVPVPLPATPLSNLSVTLTPYATDSYGAPQYIQTVNDGSGRIAVNDTGGQLFLTSEQAPSLSTPYLNLATAVSGYDNDFMGVAFAPDFKTSGKFYTAYQAQSGTGITPIASSTPGVDDIVIREWTATDPSAGTFSGTSREVLRMAMPTQGHTIGSIGFNPNATSPSNPDYDKLYIGMGDTGDAGSYLTNGQNLAVPYGKILRLDPTPTATSSYTVPTDNPFVKTSGAEPLVWAYGLRNPQSFSWQIGGAGTMFINDIGEAGAEEVNTGVAGGNYGWSTREGTFATFRDPTLGIGYTSTLYQLAGADPGLLYPVAEYFHDLVHLAAIGSGFLYTGNLIPELDGKYIVADIATGRLYYTDIAGLVSTDDPANTIGFHELTLDFGGIPQSLLDILGQGRADARLGLGPNGELYLATKGGGEIFALSDGTVSVPAPASAALFPVGLLGLAWARRRSRGA